MPTWLLILLKFSLLVVRATMFHALSTQLQDLTCSYLVSKLRLRKVSLAIQGQTASSGVSVQKLIARGTAPHHVRDFSSLASIAL